jgi:hypothetical protein
MVQNFITSILGSITKTEVNGRCVWVLPCDLDEAIPGYPKEDNEGVLCYFRRILSEGIVGEANRGQNLGTGTGLYQGMNGFNLTFMSILEGLNIDLSDDGETLTIAFKYASVPASATAAGTAGQVAYDSSFLYFCIATDTWRRIALATWS